MRVSPRVRWLLSLVAGLCAGCGGSASAASEDPAVAIEAPVSFSIGGERIGDLRSFTGGATTVTVVEVPAVAPSRWAKKHIGNVAHEPFTVEVGLGTSVTMLDWIRDALDGGAQVLSGEVVAERFEHKIEFFDAHITEIKFPAMDGSSKDPAYFTIKIEPESLRSTQDAIAGPVPPVLGTPWMSANFRLTIGDLPCSRVSKIDSFTFIQGVVIDDATKHPGKLEVPNLSFYVSTADIGSWTQYQTSFLSRGGTEADELNGAIEFLSPDHSTVLGRITLRNMGIVSLDALIKEEPARFHVEMYVEVMQFAHGTEGR